MGFSSISTKTLLSSETVNATATVYSQWQTGVSTDLRTFFVLIESGSGPEVDVYLDVTPLGQDLDYDESSKTNFSEISLASAVSTASEIQRYADDDYAYPCAQWRLRIVGTSSNGSDTVVSAWASEMAEA